MQIPYLPVPGRKVPRFLGGSIGSRMDLCGTSGLPIAMVPRLHQSNGNIKRKLRAWRVQKCITLVGADTVLRVCNLEYESTAMNDFMRSVKDCIQVLIVGAHYVDWSCKFVHSDVMKNFSFRSNFCRETFQGSYYSLSCS